MAVTKLWKVENNLKKVLDYTKNPDKTRKLKYSLEDIQSLKNVLAYAKDEEKTEQEFYVSGINCNSVKACEQFVDVKTQYGKADGIQAYHGYMSFKDTDNVTPELAHQIGMEFARRVWGDRFQIVVTTHLNTKCLHCHFVINSVSFADGKMMHGKEKAWFYFRHIADEVCREYNLSVIEKPQTVKHSDFLIEQDNKGKPTRYNLVREAIDEAISHSCNKQEFEHYLKKMGYKYRLSDNLKYWTVIPKGYEKPIRLYKLGESYANDKIMERLIENGSAVRLKPFQKTISYSVPKEIDLRCKKGSLYNRYLYYCYKLGYLPKKEKPKYNNAKLHYLLREDLMKLDKITEETRLLAKYQIDTDKQLFSFKESLENEIRNLTADRTHLRNKIRRKNIDDVTLSKAKDKISEISRRLKTLRREIALCDDIAQRSKVMEKNIEQIERDEEKSKDKEVRRNEQWR